MLTSIYYFSYLFAVILLYWAVPGRSAKTLVLLGSSWVFIYHHSPESLAFLVGSSLVTYFIGKLIAKDIKARLLHRLGVLILLSSLFFTKYVPAIWNTVDELISGLGRGQLPSLPQILIPLGISYIVFKYISYLTDIYWKVGRVGSFLDFLTFGSLFTIFFAGPIERFDRFSKQLQEPAEITTERLNLGFGRIIQGIGKKYLVVNWLFSNIISGSVWGGGVKDRLIYSLAYAVYIYLDFSAYSDIAIGSSALLGLKIRENFAFPYSATNITDFWKRWHISLSEWIRDYLFFPLSGLFDSDLWLKLIVPVAAMGLCGIWHGSGLEFLLWGLIHGFMIGCYQIWGKKAAKKVLGKGLWSQLLANFLFMIFIVSSWIFFYPGQSGRGSDYVAGNQEALLVFLLFGATLLWSLLNTRITAWQNSKVIRFAAANPILVHSLLLVLTIGLGTFNTDNTFVYVDF